MNVSEKFDVNDLTFGIEYSENTKDKVPCWIIFFHLLVKNWNA